MLLSRKPLDVAADAETASRVRFTSFGDNFPFADTLRAVSYSVIYDNLSEKPDSYFTLWNSQASSPK